MRKPQWESWLLEVDAYWDGVELTVTEGTALQSVWGWLSERLGALTVDQGRQAILLESLEGDENAIEVRIRPSAEPVDVIRRPQWGERRIVRQLAESFPSPVPATFPHDVQLCAFHSFKGGVGRTLHCVALALELAKRTADASGRGRRVLLIDADLDAPGISWMVAGDGSRADVALDDLLALLHGSSLGDHDRVTALVRKFLVNQEHDGILVLPTTRDTTRIGLPRIQPADLLTPERSPYFLTEAFAELAHAVGADTCLIDLRAGTGELSAPILLDPRVQRVFVSTISDQSVQGTSNLLNQLSLRAPSQNPTDPACAVLITQFQEEEHGSELTNAAAALAEAVAGTLHSAPLLDDSDETITVDQQVTSQPLYSPFTTQLLALPRSWADVRDRIEQASLSTVVSALADSLSAVEANPPIAGQAGSQNENRVRLAELAKSLTYAETAGVYEDFLPTEALQNLAQAHKTSAPVVVAVGAKGSGKTFTYLLMCRHRTWKAFGEAAGVREVELAAPLVPVLASQNLAEELRVGVETVRKASADVLTGESPDSFLSLRDFITKALYEQRSEVEWRQIWLTCMARAAGLDATPETAEAMLTDLARNRRAVFVIDGLEDLFQDFSKDERQQSALRALLTGCPEWLRSLRGLPLGLVVFVRRDLVENSIHQNARQFLERYRAFELRWNRTEALRLVAWVSQHAQVLNAAESFDILRAGAKELSQLLIQVWGKKLGSDNSREARSEEWFLAALSDYNLQIQARDIVFFLAQAARDSAGEDNTKRWLDRLLTPQAMRKALPVSSREKIDAIAQENAPVGRIFNRLQELPTDVRKIPFTLASAKLDLAEARLLEANGVLFREGDQHWIPEIYRHGLGFGISKVGRPRIMSINKLIRDRGDVGLPQPPGLFSREPRE